MLTVCVFASGFFLGGGISAYFLHSVSAHFSKVKDEVNYRAEMMSSFALLHQLRSSNINGAIDLLEMQLDTGLLI